jgi:hypothetical protein
MTPEEKRALFERGLESLKRKGIACFPLAIMEINGKFHHYMDSDTDSAWIGFQLACNAMENMAKAKGDAS